MATTLALHKALNTDDVVGVRRLLEANECDTNVRNHNGDTALHCIKVFRATDTLPISIFDLLVSHGADVNARNTTTGLAPLHNAAARGDIAIIRLLVSHGADVNAKDSMQRTALHFAADSSRGGAIDPAAVAIVDLLLRSGADVNARNSDDRTPLHCTTRGGVARALAENGADVHAVDTFGWSVISLASRNGNAAVVQVLLEHGATLHTSTR